MNELQFAKYKLINMIDKTHDRNKNERNHVELSWTPEEFLRILQDNKIYTVKDSVLGDLEFPLKLTNGWYNTCSPDRIDDNIGYSIDNIEFRPSFLNNSYKISTQMIREIVIMREVFTEENMQYLSCISKEMSLYNDKFGKVHENSPKIQLFYTISKTAKKDVENKEKSRNLQFDFYSIKECAVHLMKLFIKQGGRCSYSGCPLYLEVSHPYKISPERIDPSKSYSKDNITLITIGLNAAPPGQWRNTKLSDEQIKIALDAAVFNQEYWDSSTKLTPERKLKCEEVAILGRKLMEQNSGKFLLRKFLNAKNLTIKHP